MKKCSACVSKRRNKRKQQKMECSKEKTPIKIQLSVCPFKCIILLSAFCFWGGLNPNSFLGKVPGYPWKFVYLCLHLIRIKYTENDGRKEEEDCAAEERLFCGNI